MHCGRSYYGLTAAGYRIPFKPLMTIMQLFQCCCGAAKVAPAHAPPHAPPHAPAHATVVRGAAGAR